MLGNIRRRIYIPFLLLILVTMGVLGLYLSKLVRDVYYTELESKLAAEARLIGEGLEPYFADGADPQTVNTLAHHYADLLDARVTIIDPIGIVIGESHNDPENMGNHLTRPEITAALATGEGKNTRYSTTMRYQSMYFASRVDVNEKKAAIVRVSIPLAQVEASQRRIQGAILGATLLASVVAVLLAAWIAGATTRPIRQLAQKASHLAHSDFLSDSAPEQLPHTSEDESELLADAFNHLASKLQHQADALRDEQDKVDAIFRTMHDGVIIIDPDGKIKMINPGAEEMFSLQSADVLGRTLAEGLRHHQIVDLWQRCLASGESESALIEISTEQLFLQTEARPLGISHSSTLLLFTNLSRQRYLETVRRDFISNLSHELRTPLASLKALTETLQSGALDDPPAAKRFLQRIETEVDALTQMVAELLELSRIESGRVPLQFQPADPALVVLSAVDRLRLQAERAHLTLRVDCHANLPVLIADVQRLEQVLVNLLHNAIKFTPPGGEIEVCAEAVNGGEGSPASIVFSVRDTGVGIPADDMPRIFERFYKADRARASGGTGLGLAIARHSVEAHSGRLWAESIEGKGSTFYFSIPVSRS